EPACVGRNALRFVFVQRRLVDQEVACGNQSKRGPPEPVSIGVGFGFSEPSSDDAQVIRTVDSRDPPVVDARNDTKQRRYRGARAPSQHAGMTGMAGPRDEPVA